MTTNRIKTYDLRDFVLNHRPQHMDDSVVQYNLLLNDPEYSYLSGLIHVNRIKEQAILFTDIEYNEDKYYVLKDLSNILIYIPLNNITTLNLKTLLQKTKDIKYKYSNLDYDYNLVSKIRVIFKQSGINFLYKLHSYKPINIVTTVKNLTIDNFKNNLINTISDLFTSIETYKENGIESLISNYYYSIFEAVDNPINLVPYNIKVLQHINNEIARSTQQYNDKLIEFRELCLMYIKNARNMENNDTPSYSVSNHTVTDLVKNHKLFKIFIVKDNNKYYKYQYSLVFQFNNIKLSITDTSYGDHPDHFIIANLMYANEYENVLIHFKNKLFQTM